MSELHIICLSDIHFDKNEPENQGLVVSEFFNDLPKVIGKYDRDSLYCVISGDLVASGNTERLYDDFANLFIKKLTKYVPLDHIIVLAGNHDLNRNILSQAEWKKKQNELVDSKESETDYNDLLKEKRDSLIVKKFAFFEQFVRNSLQLPDFNLFGYAINIVPEISIYCLNTALLSNGGLEGFPEDRGRLRIETSGLYQWSQENQGRIKILCMHHPLHHLTEYAQDLIDNIVRKGVDIIVTGHLHKQDFKQYLGKEQGTVKYCSSPQLFSDKRDHNGYSIMHFVDCQLDTLEYRKWSTINEEFIDGSEFTRTPNGIITFQRAKAVEDDAICRDLEDRLTSSLCSYNYTPSWVDRIISNVAPGMSSSDDEIKWDHISIINSNENIQIVGGAQFGLTCLSHKLVLEAWKIKKEHWLYIEGRGLRISQVKSCVEDIIKRRNITEGDIKTLVVDNWNKTYDDKEKIMSKIERLLPDVRLILLNNEDDTQFFAGLNNQSYEEGYKIVYLRELSRKEIRHLSQEFINRQKFDADEDGKILERLIRQLMELNVHRTPINCLQLLLNFQQNYDAHPIDRTKILKSLIMFFFLKPDSYFYTDAFDETDCCVIMGKLCETLLRNSDGHSYQRCFTEDNYLEATKSLNSTYNENTRRRLLKAMIDAQIIVPYLNSFEFRFSYWVYFFAAYQMYKDADFYTYMVDNEKCIYMPDLVEFYTGIDPKCNSLVVKIVDELLKLSEDVTTNLVPALKDPYPGLTFRPNPSFENRTKEQLEEGIRSSKLPNEIKDAIMDKRDDCTRPYFQMINTVLDQYKVRNMMSLARSASRAFRNGQLITDDNRNKLYASVQVSWMALLKVLQLLTPVLTKTGYGDLGGASFRLAGDFPKEEGKKLMAVLTSLPFNVIEWYRNDVYSEKRATIYRESVFHRDAPSVCRHLNALLLVRCRPKGWQEVVEKYMETVGKNSFYLADTKNMLHYCYRIDEMSDADEKRTAKLLMSAIERMKKTYVDPYKDRFFKTAPKKDKELLPKREVSK